MNFITRFIITLYSKLLVLYPRRFRNEFANEMHTVFRDSVADVVTKGSLSVILLCGKEFAGMPFSILKEFWHEAQGKELIMLHENSSSSPVSTGQVLMGALPFFLFGLIMILLEMPFYLFDMDWFNSLGGYLFLALLILPALGFGIGWVQNFPRWSYPYTGMALILAFYIQNASTPGITLFGIPIFGRDLWGWRAWVPLAAAFVIALAVSRSFKPFIRFFTNLWNDWTIPSYLMVGVLPLLVMIAFDEIDRMYSLYYMVPFGILMVGMVVFYLRARNAWQRVLALTLGVIAVIFPSAWGSASYWLPRDGMYSFSSAQDMLTQAVIVIIVMLLPAWLELLRRSVARLRTTRS